ncbi:MAG: aldehyde ferredoxin oxidoreductase C-terminal domain-containing protein [Candidatus Bipolaricaulota bacterium]|nr:aldehyde ferredoxin oxidoreductase C-terminal domain-containing protein [Candidatus Bipolaricaulota bacterium]
MGTDKRYPVIAEYNYNPTPVRRGYSGQTLHINISTGKIEPRPVTQEMKDKFIGGRGFGLWRLWNAVNDDTKWDDPENEIVIAVGPIGGITTYPGAGKSLVVSISPTTGSVIDSNVGGYFGPYLKFSGWDALEIQGKSDKDLILFIDGDNGSVQILESNMQDLNTHVLSQELLYNFADSDNPRDLLAISTVSAGAGAEYTRIGCLNFSFFDMRRKLPRVKQAGRGGIGTVFRDKRIAALVVKRSGITADSNGPADLERLKRAGKRINKEILKLDASQSNMRRVGTSHLVEIMDEYDLLPVQNYRFGSHPEAEKISSPVWERRFSQGMPDGCWLGCTMACSHAVDGFTLKTGPYKGERVLVDGPEYETIAGSSNMGIYDPDFTIEMNFYCDTYGLDTISFTTGAAFVMECYQAGVLNREITDGLELNFGNSAAALELLHQLGRGDGFGTTFGQGIRRMKEHFVQFYGADPDFLNDIGMECKGMEYSEYVTKESLAMQGGYGLALKGPQHDEAWLIFMDMVNNQIPTFEDKGEALHYFPMWRTWFGLMGLCKLPWNDIEPADNQTRYSGIESAKVPEHVNNYCELFAGITGIEVTPDDLILQSERVYNFQRVFNLRLGYGRREQDAIPYRSAGPVTEEEYKSRAERYDKQLKEKVGIDPAGMSTAERVKALRKFREGQYEKLCDAAYKRRGWTSAGVPKIETLKRLGIDFPDVIKIVEPYQ